MTGKFIGPDGNSPALAAVRFTMSKHPKNIAELIGTLSAGGEWTIGQVIVRSDCSLRHRDDRDVHDADLVVNDRPEEAREIAKYDGTGKYRPLKSAPNLKRGWILRLESLADVRLALDFFYPAALGLYLSALHGSLRAVPLRETLSRQTGMYRITQLTRDDQAEELIRTACNSESGCMRQLLWELSPGQPQPFTQAFQDSRVSREVPLLCAEACNLLVAACRPLGKANLPVAKPESTS